MNADVFFGLNVILLLIEMVALYLLGSCFFQCKFGWMQTFFRFVLLFGASLLCHVLVPNKLVLRLALLVGIDTVWLTVTFQAHLLKSVVAAILFTSFLLLGDSIFLMGFAAITGQDMQSHMQNPYAYYLISYILKITELLAIVILRLCIHRNAESRATHWRNWMRTVMFPIMSAVIAVMLMHIYLINSAAAPQILVCSIVLVMTDILAIFLLNYLEQQQQELHEYSIVQHSTKLAQDSVAAWMSAYDTQRQQTHDFQNRMAVIRNLAEKEAPNGDLLKYVNQFVHLDYSNALFVKTGRAVVDAILNQKYALAMFKKIEFQVYLDNLSPFALSDDDFVILLSNLIDNAIEACEKIQEPTQRWICLKIRVEEEAGFLYIENTTAKLVQIRNNHVITTKKNVIEHGYGLKNIERVLERNKANYILGYREEKHLFFFSAQIGLTKNMIEQ